MQKIILPNHYLTMMGNKDFTCIADLPKKEWKDLFEKAEAFATQAPPPLLKGRLLANCFFEPSTRTRLSFEAAMHRLGGAVIGFADSLSTSVQKGESLHDTIRVIGSYADIVVIRHSEAGAAEIASSATDKPVINAGDGGNEHPTQTLVDLYTILQRRGTIDGLNIGIAGDLKHGRAVHSLCKALSEYKVRLTFFSAPSLDLPKDLIALLKEKGIACKWAQSMEELVGAVDVLYMTRIQKERFAPGELKNPCLLKRAHLRGAKGDLMILHPLPRVDEIDRSIDETKFAAYFEQAANGVPVRMALLAFLLDKSGSGT